MGLLTTAGKLFKNIPRRYSFFPSTPSGLCCQLWSSPVPSLPHSPCCAPRDCFSAHCGQLLCAAQCLLRVPLQLGTAVRCTALCRFPLLPHTNRGHSKGSIPLPCCSPLCETQSFPRVCLVPRLSRRAADVEQLVVGAMQHKSVARLMA